MLNKNDYLLSLAVNILLKSFPNLGYGDYFEKFIGDNSDFIDNKYS